jgi:murein DD-endopeptidase MepM/ murein hydrolase activator NlpD
MIRLLSAGFIVIGVILLLSTSGSLTPNIVSPKERVFSIRVPQGKTFSQLAGDLGLATDTAAAIFESSKKIYDLSMIKAGNQLALIEDAASGELEKMIYDIDSENQVVVELENDVWQARTQIVPYEIKEEKVSGVIDSSLYESFLENNFDVRLALMLAEMFAWQVDFAADIRVGDEFKVIYEARYLDGRYRMPGKILAAEFVNDGEIFRGYYFESDKTKAGYYDEQGKSLQKVFLKSPLQYKYISSGFSYARLNPITKKIAPHRGIDYAANYGTPAVSVGDGTVVQAGWNGPYGISVMIRHNETYTSRYGHFSSLAKNIRVGAKVKQGQVVGYVGDTGEATGPHLHYEIHKFGTLVNPFRIEVPPGEPINESDKASFQLLISTLIGSKLWE